MDEVHQPGAKAWMCADLRLHEDDPTERRTVTVTVPEGRVLSHRLTGIDDQPPRRLPGRERHHLHVWSFQDLPADPEEPQAPPGGARPPAEFHDELQGRRFRGRRATTSKSGDSRDTFSTASNGHKEALDDRRGFEHSEAVGWVFQFRRSHRGRERMNCREASAVFKSKLRKHPEAGALAPH